MKRFIGIIAILLFFCSTAFSMAKYADYVQEGGKSVKTSSTTTYLLMQTFPNATVGVYLPGTTTLATIYSNNSGTPKSNPFTADSKAYYEFYAANGFYDVKFSGTGIVTPWTRTYITLSDPSESYNPKSFGAKCDNSSNDTVAFQTIITLIGSTISTIDIPKLGPCRIDSLTFLANITLNFASGGGIYANSGATINYFGAQIGPKVKRFYNSLGSLVAGNGTIFFTNNSSIEKYYPQWIGIVNDGSGAATDNQPILQALINAVGDVSTISFSRNLDLAIYSQLLISSRVQLKFLGEGGFNPITPNTASPTIRWKGANGGTMLEFEGSYECLVEGMHFVSKLTSTTGANKILNFDGPGFTSSHLIKYNSFDNQNRNNNFIAINIGANGGNNNEFFTIDTNNFYVGDPGEGYNAGYIVVDGNIINGTNTISTALVGYFTHTAFGATTQNLVGQPIRITKAGTAGGVFESTIVSVSVDGTSATLADNAITTTTTGKVVVGRGYGIGVNLESSSNIKNVYIKHSNISWARNGIRQLNGSMDVEDISGGFSDVDVNIAQFTEYTSIKNINTENSHVGVIAITGNGTLIIEKCRNSSATLLGDSYFQFGNVPNIRYEDNGLEYEPPIGSTFFSFSNLNIKFISIANSYIPSTGFNMTMDRLGFKSFQDAINTGNGITGTLTSISDKGITDAPNGSNTDFKLGFGADYIETHGNIGLYAVVRPTSNIGASGDFIGIRGKYSSTITGAIINRAIGIQGEIDTGATGQQIEAIGVYSKLPASLGNGNATADFYGFKTLLPTVSGGNHRDGYGLYLSANPSAGMTGSRYGIYQAGTNDLNILFGTLKLNGILFANLPASPTAGMVRTITDSNTIVWGATIAGGGANTVLAFYDGTNWTVFAK